jgi:hypothetical protein
MPTCPEPDHAVTLLPIVIDIHGMKPARSGDIRQTDRKSLFGWHRPAEAENMPEPVWSSDITGRTLA